MTRRLIVTADDFGRSPGINRGIVEAFENGIVTSASLMVRWPAAREAAGYARRRVDLAVGLHVDLGEWRYRDGAWEPVYEVVSPDNHEEVEAEVVRQLERFRKLLGRDPTHVDSHQHVHRSDPIRAVFSRFAKQLRVPLRDVTPGIRYCGDFHAQTAKGEPVPDGVSVASLISIVASLPDGTTELACHPGRANDGDSVYAVERSQEVETLCDPRVREVISRERIVLSSFADAVVSGVDE
jgi:chitin disaccharide deacetylase